MLAGQSHSGHQAQGDQGSRDPEPAQERSKDNGTDAHGAHPFQLPQVQTGSMSNVRMRQLRERRRDVHTCFMSVSGFCRIQNSNPRLDQLC